MKTIIKTSLEKKYTDEERCKAPLILKSRRRKNKD